MNNQAFYKINDGEAFCNRLVILMPGVMKRHGVTIVRINSGGSNNRSSEISADILNGCLLYTSDKENSCQKLTFDRGLEFIETNQGYDNWFLQIESFDPHEPFYSFEEYLKQYEKPALDRDLDWPPYDRVHQTEEEIAYIRAKYMAMISMCDENLGRVLDMMDRYDLWKDTMLIVNTDHGFLLGEHGWWAVSYTHLDVYKRQVLL